MIDPYMETIFTVNDEDLSRLFPQEAVEFFRIGQLRLEIRRLLKVGRDPDALILGSRAKTRNGYYFHSGFSKSITDQVSPSLVCSQTVCKWRSEGSFWNSKVLSSVPENLRAASPINPYQSDDESL